MTQKIARYAVTYGLAGCYVPDSHLGALEFSTRGAFVDFIRRALEDYDMPASLIRVVQTQRIWRFIQRNGSSAAHFAIAHKGHELAFYGLTEDEFNQQNNEDF